ncbi:MAG: GatB/YqeY domain-containing protein [Sporichthyaceae bacterium]|nr:GatB/YqeY domain-containing protein [Sporichthyaceae bacterium]
MTTLKDRLQDDLRTAIKSRDELRAATLRLALTAVKTEEVAGTTARELSDDEVRRVLAKEAKKRREAATAFEDAGRADRAARERAEGTVLDEYLPTQLSDAELADLVTAAIAEAGATEPRAMGQVMKIVTPKVAGRAEGGRVAAEVRRQLGQGESAQAARRTV